jgi:hypothetical protein
LFRKAVHEVLHAQRTWASLLERFPQVVVLDSTTITLPAALAAEFPGCGGGHGGGEAAVKVQVQCDLRSGAVTALDAEPGRVCDAKSAARSQRLPPGTLRLSDLGYFDTEVFERLTSQGEFWLSRLLFGTAVFTPDGRPLALFRWLAAQPGPVVDQPILMGAQRRVACRLVAWRGPEGVPHRRRQKLIADTQRKDGRTPRAERWAWCDWLILVTHVPVDRLAPREIAVLCRARWQVELLFKRGKALGLVARLAGSVTRQLVPLWSRLRTVVLPSWLVLCSVWGELQGSLFKACRAIPRHAVLLIAAGSNRGALIDVIARRARLIRKTARQNKRKNPSTFELLEDPSRVGDSLT